MRLQSNYAAVELSSTPRAVEAAVHFARCSTESRVRRRFGRTAAV